MAEVAENAAGPLHEQVNLSFHLLSGECIADVSVDHSCSGAQLRALAQKYLGPRKAVSRLLAGAKSMRNDDTVASIGLSAGDSVLVVAVAYHERLRVSVCSRRGQAWTYANDIKGSMFVGCGDDFKLRPAINGDGDAVSFEAQAKRDHFVAIQNKQLQLVRLNVSIDYDYSAACDECSFRLHFPEDDESGRCTIEPCSLPGFQIGCNPSPIHSNVVAVHPSSIAPGQSGFLEWHLQENSGNGPLLLRFP
eukprot:TRINITY_DN43154_c0_g1_i1.p1 TRINITY_DN43154_c0_g1~~TRINITY_DN43154_c0_g1_i1.p1  ORF type:complete len:249 (-),score=23.63 TRINITY_DN43154_c0_g1_i1:397-1143(-)